MKKIFLVLIVGLITVSLSGQSIFKRGVRVGNDKTGTSIVTVDSITGVGSNFKLYNGATRLTESDVINDSLAAVRANALNLGDYSPLWTDTVSTVATKTDLLGVSGAKNYRLEFRVDTTTGAPSTGDSTYVDTQLIGMHVEAYRNGHLQYLKSEDHYVSDSYEFNSVTGTVTFHPVFATNDKIILEYSNTIIWEEVAITGQESALLTSLRAYYGLNEASGIAVNDELNTYDGTTNATVNSAGINGVCETFNGTDDVASLGATVGDIGTSDLSYSLWVYLDNLPSANKGILGNYNGVSTFWYLRTNSSNMLSANFNADDDPQYTTETNGALSADTWYHVVVTLDRDANQTIYLNGVKQTDEDDISSESAVAINNNADFNIGNIGDSTATFFIAAKIDEVAIWVGRVLSQSDVTELYNAGVGKFYPF